MHQVTSSARYAALAFVCGAPLAAAQTQQSLTRSAVSARSISPVFHQLVAFTLPAPFTAAFEKTNGGFYIREHVPAGETVDDWSRMITVTGSSGLASDERATPQAYLQAIARGFQRHCPDTFATLDLGAAAVHEYAAYEVITSCGHIGEAGGKAHSETAIMLAIKGLQDFYTFQWAERGPDSSRAPAIDEKYWQAQLAKLRPIRFCPIVPGEAAPYPSCTGRQ
jgi:hypothetical protein